MTAVARALHGLEPPPHVLDGPEEAVRTYFQGRADVRFGGAQRLIVGTVPA